MSKDPQKQDLAALRAENERLRAALSSLRERESRYRHAIAAADGVVYQLDFKRNQYTYLDEEIERLIGYTAKETTPELWSRIGKFYQTRGPLAGLEDSEAVRRFRGGEVSVWCADYECTTKEGTTRWISDSSVPIRDDHGRVTGCLGILQDITERKQAEDALLESEQLYQDTFDHAAVGIARVGLVGRWLHVNPKLCDMLGFDMAELLQRTFQEITYPGDVDSSVAHMKRALCGETGSYELEKRYIRSDGSLLWAHVTVALVRDRDSQPLYFISVIEDISQRKKLEEQLLQVQKMESIGRLAGCIAHDFNNLLTAIMGYSSLAMASLSQGSDAERHLANVQKAGEAAATLTSQLLAFARKQIIAPQRVDLNSLIINLDQMVHRLIGEDIELRILPGNELWTVHVDPGQMEQVLINLCVNARDAMPDGGILTIETANASLTENDCLRYTGVLPGSYVKLTVTDTGIGIEDEVQPHIFEPFFTTKDKGKGTGLGLATCHGIIKQSGGHIWLQSQLGVGSTFTLLLPRIPGKADFQRVIDTSEVPTGRGNILLVEDEDLVREYAAESLRSIGYRVITAKDGVDALQIADRHGSEFDLLLTDVVMPKMSGRALAGALIQECPNLRVLFTSGYTDNTILQHGVLEPDVAFIQKPYDLPGLARKVHEVLNAPG